MLARPHFNINCVTIFISLLSLNSSYLRVSFSERSIAAFQLILSYFLDYFRCQLISLILDAFPQSRHLELFLSAFIFHLFIVKYNLFFNSIINQTFIVFFKQYHSFDHSILIILWDFQIGHMPICHSSWIAFLYFYVSLIFYLTISSSPVKSFITITSLYISYLRISFS
jgi:hypothetical protein